MKIKNWRESAINIIDSDGDRRIGLVDKDGSLVAVSSGVTRIELWTLAATGPDFMNHPEFLTNWKEVQ